MKLTRMYAALAIVAGLFFAACSDDDDNNNVVETDQVEQNVTDTEMIVSGV